MRCEALSLARRGRCARAKFFDAGCPEKLVGQVGDDDAWRVCVERRLGGARAAVMDDHFTSLEDRSVWA